MGEAAKLFITIFFPNILVLIKIERLNIVKIGYVTPLTKL